ncbi:MAG TPA: LysR family transcriptional regulator [Edaphobacter sp.]|nr:LysR family transcriptional regulator [Edaphobacter sp.]
MRFDEQALSDANVFVAVVRCGSFANAARSLNLSQSVASRAVARLEKRLGVRVLERTTRSVSLTDDGRGLFEGLEPLLQGFEDAFTSVAEEQSRVRGRLRVKMHPTLAHVINGKQLKTFLENYSELSVELISSDKLGDLVGKGIDIGLYVGELPSSSLIAKRLLDTRVITIAAPAYLVKHGKIAHPSDLLKQEHSLIDYRNPETGRTFQWEYHRGPKIVKIATPGRLIVSDIVNLHGICVAGWGIAQVLEAAVKPMLETGALVKLLPEWGDERFPIYAVYPSRNYVPPKMRVFMDFVSSAVSNDTRP